MAQAVLLRRTLRPDFTGGFFVCPNVQKIALCLCDTVPMAVKILQEPLPCTCECECDDDTDLLFDRSDLRLLLRGLPGQAPRGLRVKWIKINPGDYERVSFELEIIEVTQLVPPLTDEDPA
jgi:hypothetical protein